MYGYPHDQPGNLYPPPYRRNVPRYKTKKRSGFACCLKCICCFYCCMFLLVLILCGAGFGLYMWYQPRVPSYKVDSFKVRALNVKSEVSLHAEFTVTVKADNPNKYIGLEYGKDSSVTVSYRGSKLCSGKIPEFKQPGENITVMAIELKGNSEFGNAGLPTALMESNKNEEIPLSVVVKAPITIYFGKWPLKKITVNVKCSLLVNSLKPGKDTKIDSSDYSVSATLR